MPNTGLSQRPLSLNRNENPKPKEPAQHPLLGRKELMQILGEVKNKKEKVLTTIEKPKTKNVKKNQKKAVTHTEGPIRIQILQRQKRRG